MRKGDLKVRLPNAHGRDISVALQREILRQAGIRPSAWENA
jgi:hypothetical protein